MKTTNLICIFVLLVFSKLSISQNYIEYSNKLNGVYIQEYDGTPDYNDIYISSPTGDSKPFNAVLGNCYNDGGSRFCETNEKRIFMGGRDGDEIFIEQDEDNAYSIWFEVTDSDTVCVIAYDYEYPTKYILNRKATPVEEGEVKFESESSTETNDNEIPEYIKEKDWDSNFYGECFMGYRGEIRIDGDGADQFIGYLEIFNEGFDENGDGEYDSENDVAPYLTQIYFQCEGGLYGNLTVKVWEQNDNSPFEYSEKKMEKTESYILFDSIKYELTDCR
ncbi:MAG: hypothetical protein WDZ35_06205 [Crocinitomicaceae bacterium]